MNEDRKSRFWATVGLVAALTHPILFVVSAGPSAFLAGKGVLDSEAYFSLYSLVFLILPDWVGKVFDEYTYWCAVLGADSAGGEGVPPAPRL